jgi:hypothetical protein
LSSLEETEYAVRMFFRKLILLSLYCFCQIFTSVEFIFKIHGAVDGFAFWRDFDNPVGNGGNKFLIV